MDLDFSSRPSSSTLARRSLVFCACLAWDKLRHNDSCSRSRDLCRESRGRAAPILRSDRLARGLHADKKLVDHHTFRPNRCPPDSWRSASCSAISMFFTPTVTTCSLPPSTATLFSRVTDVSLTCSSHRSAAGRGPRRSRASKRAHPRPSSHSHHASTPRSHADWGRHRLLCHALAAPLTCVKSLLMHDAASRLLDPPPPKPPPMVAASSPSPLFPALDLNQGVKQEGRIYTP